jgi:hypothetical protein
MVYVGRYGGVKSALSALFSPRQNPCQIMSNDFSLISNFTRVCLGYFGATLIFGFCGFKLWKIGNTSELWEGFRIQISKFSEFSMEFSLEWLF